MAVVPRIYITVEDGIPNVVCADGPVHVVLVDFDQENNEPTPMEYINAMFEGGVVSTVTPAEFDLKVSQQKGDFAKMFGVPGKAKPPGR